MAAQASAYAPGTRMAFAGINNDKQRADVIAYLRTLSDNPPPLPTANEAPQPRAATGQPAASASAAAGGTTAAADSRRPRLANRRPARAISRPELDRFVAAAEAAADVAGAVVRPFFRAGVAVDTKSDRSPVTIADRTAEAGDARRAGRAVPRPRHAGRGVRPRPARTPGCAGCWTRSTAPAPSSAAARPSAR